MHNNSNNSILSYKHFIKLLSQILEVQISSTDRGILKVSNPPFPLYHRNIMDAHLYTSGADKSLARPGNKQATITKLGIYSNYSPRSSIHFLARCSNFCKPLKKIENIVRPTWSPRQQ